MIPVRPLGDSGISVSEICLGTMQFTWTCTEAVSYRILETYEQAGGAFIDTADIYTTWHEGNVGGEAETIIGKWMKRRKNRRKIFLASKGMVRMWPGTTGEGAHRLHLVAACDDSLKRMQTDTIDLYQIHWPDTGTPNDETLKALRDLLTAGKIRSIGCSNYSPSQFAECLALARHAGLPKFVSIQPKYNLLERSFEKDHAWLCTKYRVGVIPYSPLSGGFLTGKYREGRPLPRSARIEWQKHLLNDRMWRVIAELERLGKKRVKTIPQMALGWHLARPWMTAPIVGANSPEQLKNSLGAAGLKLTPEDVKSLDEASK